MKRCKVCGARLKLRLDLRYEITKYPVGFNVLTQPPITYECFDCCKCGCQNIVGVREAKNEIISSSNRSIESD